MEKGRWFGAIGESSHFSKLLSSDVMTIRRLYLKHSYTFQELGDWFGVTKKSVHSIVRRETWRHI